MNTFFFFTNELWFFNGDTFQCIVVCQIQFLGVEFFLLFIIILDLIIVINEIL